MQIPTGSMEDTLLPGDHLLINKLAFRWYGGEEPVRFLPFAEVVRKDVVVFKHWEPSSEPAYYVKRVVALPGETVEILEKQVFIDGAPLDEPYAVFKEPARRDLSPRDNYGRSLYRRVTFSFSETIEIEVTIVASGDSLRETRSLANHSSYGGRSMWRGGSIRPSTSPTAWVACSRASSETHGRAAPAK